MNSSYVSQFTAAVIVASRISAHGIFRNMLVMEDGQTLWLARATPRAWLEQNQRIAVHSAPTHFGPVTYVIDSDADHGRIDATIAIPTRQRPQSVLLRFRHPQARPIKSVEVDGQPWTDFDKEREVIRINGLSGKIAVRAIY